MTLTHISDDGRKLLELAERVEAATGMDNSLDVLVEIALFQPDDEWASIRANNAGTKTICTTHGGSECTFWARDFTISAGDRRAAAIALRARANTPEVPHD